MGGSALKNVITRRVDKDEFIHLSNEISRILSAIEGVKRFSVVPSYNDKIDFGDIDVLIVANVDRIGLIKNHFHPTEIYHNSDVISFDFHECQVDFIFTKEENFISSLNYMRNSDMGNLLGRIYHKMGLRFGHDGLTLIVRDDTQVVGEILLTRDIDQILAFGGFDPDIWHRGFDNLEQIFNYVVSTPYYNYEIFDLDNRNYRARTRDRKRPTYTEFLKWAQENVTENGYEWNSNKAAYLPRILHTFGKLDEFYDLLKKHSLNLDIKAKFNGEIVMSLTGLQGKELGAFMTNFKAKFSKEDMSKMTAAMIREEILTEFQSKYD